MSEEHTSDSNSEEQQDAKADMWAIIIIFTTVVIMAMHFVSGFTFDF